MYEGDDGSGQSVPAPRLLLYGRAGCHLCDEARDVVRAVSEESGVGWTEVDVDADAGLRERYGEYVPVVLVDGVQQGYYRVDPERLRQALDRPATAGPPALTTSPPPGLRH